MKMWYYNGYYVFKFSIQLVGVVRQIAEINKQFA
jgi:hypothetical protein